MSSERAIRQILFDVADTLLHKPALWETIRATLEDAGIAAELGAIGRAHRATRELLTVPDRTGRDFYLTFNARFLEVLGILPTDTLVEQIYLNCRSLPWAPFADTTAITELGIPVGVVSNWDSTLRERLQQHFSEIVFTPVVVSAEYGTAKPNPQIYLEAVRQTGLRPNEILFIGDSVRLDMVPAVQAGMTAVLVDRHGFYPAFNGIRIASLMDLPALLQRMT